MSSVRNKLKKLNQKQEMEKRKQSVEEHSQPSDLDFDKVKDKLEKQDLDVIHQTHQLIPHFTQLEVYNFCKKFYFKQSLCLDNAKLMIEKNKDTSGQWTTVVERNSSASKSIDKRNNFSLNKLKSNQKTTSLNKPILKQQELVEVVYPENEENDQSKRAGQTRGRRQNRDEAKKRPKFQMQQVIYVPKEQDQQQQQQQKKKRNNSKDRRQRNQSEAVEQDIPKNDQNGESTRTNNRNKKRQQKKIVYVVKDTSHEQQTVQMADIVKQINGQTTNSDQQLVKDTSSLKVQNNVAKVVNKPQTSSLTQFEFYNNKLRDSKLSEQQVISQKQELEKLRIEQNKKKEEMERKMEEERIRIEEMQKKISEEQRLFQQTLQKMQDEQQQMEKQIGQHEENMKKQQMLEQRRQNCVEFDIPMTLQLQNGIQLKIKVPVLAEQDSDPKELQKQVESMLEILNLSE